MEADFYLQVAMEAGLSFELDIGGLLWMPIGSGSGSGSGAGNGAGL